MPKIINKERMIEMKKKRKILPDLSYPFTEMYRTLFPFY